MRDIEVKIAWQGQSNCQSCSIRSSVLFSELNEEDFSKIHAPIDDLHFESGVTIYAQGERGQNLYTLREGFVKLLHLNEDGTERIVRLIKQGDLFGMEALLGSPHESSAIALGRVYLCRLPASMIVALGEESPRLHRQMMKKWGEALSQSETWFSQMNTGRADLRIARFLLALAKEHEGIIKAPLFKREDMGLMMDIKLETVSRSLASLSEMNMVTDVGRSFVTIPDLEKLKKFCQQGS
jgi:CRP-like cAMP-binding protein